ncbi:MAG: DUF2325 domain-containing protein [Desulfovibrionaceae bacterium]
MCAALIGGMYRLRQEYTQAARRSGVKLKIFNQPEKNLKGQLGNVDMLIVFTNKCSHRILAEALIRARAAEIPVVRSHSCGVSSLVRCLETPTDAPTDAATGAA